MIFSRDSLRRVVADKITHDLSRRGSSLPPPPWADELVIGPEGIGADSLDLLNLAGGINQMFHLHRSGIEDLLLARRTLGGWLDLIERSWALHADVMTFTTSGSTGVPKPCTHRTRDLVAEAFEHAVRLRPARVLSAVPAHHIYGFLFTVLLPAIAGVAVVDIRAGAWAAGPLNPGDLLVSYPDHWRYLAQTWVRLPDVTGVSSTAPMPRELGRRLREGGLARLVEVYGASETGGIGWRDGTDAPFSLLGVWTSVTGRTPEGALDLAGENGRRGTTQDVVDMTGPREFRLGKRLDGAVQVGGMNVFPGRIAAILETHTDIAEARVRLADGGDRLKALLVPANPEGDPEQLRLSLHAWIRQTFSVAERPRSLRFVTELPSGQLGEVADWREHAEDAVPQSRAP